MRINISLPEQFVTEVKKRVPERQLSRFFLEAAKEKIERMERKKSLDILLDGPASFSMIEDPLKYVKALRFSDKKRERRLPL